MFRGSFYFLLLINFIPNCNAQVDQNNSSIQRVVIDEADDNYGYYLMQKPKDKKIKGVLVLFPGLGQKAESIFTESKLHNEAFENGIMVIGISTHFQIAPTKEYIDKIDLLLRDVLTKNKIKRNQFVLGGFSAGGRNVMRYVELCRESPNKHAILPNGVFAVDSPLDIYHSWDRISKFKKSSKSQITINEANWVEKLYTEKFGTTPSENMAIFKDLTPFCMDANFVDHEKHLMDLPVRVYHEINIPWRLNERNQSVKDCNYIVTSEFINRLKILGNSDAQFIQSVKEGWRNDGRRHPHSWSIVDEEECISWAQKCLGITVQSHNNKIQNIDPIIIDRTLFDGTQLSPGRNPNQPDRQLFFKNIFRGTHLNVQIISSENAFTNVGSLEIDEFLYTINGGARLNSSGSKEQIFYSNEFFVVPKGFTGRWETLGAPDFHLEISVTSTTRTSNTQKEKFIKHPVLLDKKMISGLNIPKNPSSLGLFDGQEINVELCTNESSYRLIESMSHDEMIFVLSGKIIIKNARKEEFIVNTGEAFILPKNFNGSLMLKGPQVIRTLRVRSVID